MGAWVYLGNSITAEEPGEAEPSWSLSQSLESDEPGEEGGEVAHSQHSEGWKRYKRAPREKEWSGKCVSCCPACFHTAAHHCFMLVCDVREPRAVSTTKE